MLRGVIALLAQKKGVLFEQLRSAQTANGGIPAYNGINADPMTTAELLYLLAHEEMPMEFNFILLDRFASCFVRLRFLGCEG